MIAGVWQDVKDTLVMLAALFVVSVVAGGGCMSGAIAWGLLVPKKQAMEARWREEAYRYMETHPIDEFAGMEEERLK